VSGEIIRLPEIDLDDTFPLIKAISNRRSTRSFSSEPLSYKELAALLWSAQGITDAFRGLRVAPSAGAIYPFTLYVAIKEGVYEYNPHEHVLNLHKEGDLRKDISKVGLSQRSLHEAAAVIALSYYPDALEARYKERAFRYACIEAGHIAQNVLLTAVSLGLKAVAIGAYYDDLMKDVLGLEDDVLYLIPVGRLE
jgi:SagB-type dehydrogenase family enzyme